ncbi:MAG: hypothetical protein DSZ24_06355, partial [Thermodesulfatator sp.]
MKEVRKKRREREKGFTLVELMIVIAIIAILAAVAIGQYGKYIKKAHGKELMEYARTCAGEILISCESGSDWDSAKSSSACEDKNNLKGKYFNSVDITINGNSCDNFTVKADGKNADED